MKAQDIRNDEVVGGSDLPGENIRDCALFLREIAAQFADLNERLDGFMASMMQLTKAVNELNRELRGPEPPPWAIGKAIKP